MMGVGAKCSGARLAARVGDAIGAGAEGLSHSEIMERFPDGSRKLYAATHMGVYHLPARFGCYTDDSNSALAIMRSLVELNGQLNCHHVAYHHARHWYDGCSLGPLRGYPGSAQ